MLCNGDLEDHCCWIPPFGVCPYLDVSTGKPLCSLRVELGSWDRVHHDPRYMRDILPVMALTGANCGDWPPPNTRCGTCGVRSDG